MIDAETRTFFDDHAAGGPSNVVIVHFYADGNERVGVFSTLEAAYRWVDKVRDDERLEDDESCAVFVPYIIDVPEYGNIPKNKQQ